MGIEKMLPNSVRVVVPKKGKKKVVKLGPCGDKAVAGTKLLQVVHRELEEYGAPLLDEIEPGKG